MKKIALLFVMAGGLLTAQTKNLKVEKANINWWGYKMIKSDASSHNGTLGLKNGSVVLKNNQLAGGTFVLDMTSINATDLTGEYQTKLNNHLKNGDFFEVEKYPTANFKITSLKKTGKADYNYLVTGALTVKGKTNAVTFPAKIGVTNGVVTLTSDKFSIDRQKWGIAYQSTMKDMVIKDNMDLQVSFTAK
ncbi:YceI family protein [Riemerella anatipestifer]|uniref:YceI family protein n=1 Tax=Riemerella anatipestifer TaxID=34085 RepID=UPI0007ECBB63|nr:YceI family protein [Riemerella anatipestifer]AZZ59647.1 YceI family protein [Riemerella anatipestifer]MBT0551991.1 YceI family protein [Riemerella anatipestifer]MBT0554177.1 YceI family protein [Riemerella anatipestifer]MBT0572186.1 YceI family protein [Riemerella anatipestifer]MCE3024823.1 YceI family protein [Riemerella anatipestifer]